MAKIFRELEVEKVGYSQNALVTRQLPLTVFKNLHLRLKVTHTNAGVEAITPFSMLNLVSKLQIVLNGQDTLASMPLYHLFFSNKKEFGFSPLFSIDTAAGAGKISTIDLCLPFYLPLAVSPEDTLLDARSLSSAVLEIQWGSLIGPATAVVTAAELQIFTGEFANVSQEDTFARHEFGYSTSNLDSVGLIQHKLDVGSNNQYRRLWIYTMDNTGALADTLVSKFGIMSRSFYYKNKSVDAFKGAMVNQFGVANDGGVYVIDFCPDGKMSQRLDARQLSELILEITSTVANGSFAIVKEKVIYV
jgi:hypothetical protein